MIRDVSVSTFVVSYMVLLSAAVSVSFFFLDGGAGWYLFAFSAVFLFSAFLLWVYLRVYLVSPINKVMSGLSSFNSGDFSFQIPPFGKNCAGRIIPGINALSNEISTLISGIRNTSHSAHNISEKLSEQSCVMMSGAEQQAGMLIQTAASVEQISAGVNNNLGNSIELKRVTESACQSAIHGEKVMINLTERMESISACANEMNEIVSIIDSVAFQTNILSLNAAVEAARAGSQGRGFAVVAGEVRLLAKRCSESAGNIRKLIDETNSNIGQGVILVTEAMNKMTGIVSDAEKIDDLSGRVSLATGEQERGISQITLALAELEKVNQANLSIVDDLAKSSAVLNVQVCELEEKTSHIRLDSDEVLKVSS